MNQGKLNLLCPISAILGFRAFVFTISGVTSEGPEDFVSRRRLNSVTYCSNEIGFTFWGRDPVMEASF